MSWLLDDLDRLPPSKSGFRERELFRELRLKRFFRNTEAGCDVFWRNAQHCHRSNEALRPLRYAVDFPHPDGQLAGHLVSSIRVRLRAGLHPLMRRRIRQQRPVAHAQPIERVVQVRGYCPLSLEMNGRATYYVIKAIAVFRRTYLTCAAMGDRD